MTPTCTLRRLTVISILTVALLILLSSSTCLTPVSGQENQSSPCPKPYIKTITPSAVSPEEQIKHGGSRFGSIPGSVILAGESNAVIISWSQKRIYATVPAGARSGPVTVYSGCGSASNKSHLTVKPASEEQQQEMTPFEGGGGEEEVVVVVVEEE
ncbi:MAG TPA: IPT/TIG domain-containing protein [Thermodesulfobacteriota bacterium]|nr:IPT/TIG domain-containing protein [Thermodesulfobacteriota bacterium]